MARTLLDEFQSLITPDLLSSAGAALGENPTAVGKGLGALAPALLAGIATKAGEPGGLQRLWSLLNDPANTARTTDLTSFFSKAFAGSSLAALVTQLITFLFGSRSSAVLDTVARSSGLSQSSLSSILPAAGSMVLGLLGNRSRQGGLDANGLARMLSSERGSLLSALPAGLGSLFDTDRVRETVTNSHIAAAAPRRRSLWPILIPLALLVAWWVTRHEASAPDQVSNAQPAVRPVAPPPVAVIPPLPVPSFFDRVLPGGYSLRAPQAGIERQMVSFIEDTSLSLDGTTWFDFDRLTFETDSAALKPESREQLRNVAEILKAYPTVKVRIGGYTDNTGDPAANMTLSQARAESVRSELLSDGIAADRLAAEGYGEQHPVGDNATEEGRAQNRRIALLVTSR